MSPRASADLVLALLAGLGVAAVLAIRPPRPVPATAPPERFSAERALGDLSWLAAEPRPVGSEAHERVRARLAAELEATGMEVQVQEGTSAARSPLWKGDTSGPIPLANLVARRRGTGGGGAVLLCAHYDSRPGAPGAGDDGAAVVSLLAAARALHALPPSRNDVIFLLSDGEELGLLGAELFAREHPWARDVRVVLNLEGRGAGGPVLLFQTGPASGGLVDLFARVAPHPFGSSLAPAVYERLPNDTDFTVFLREGVPGLNFAFVGGGSVYHRPGDTVAALSRGTLQQHGENALALARALADADLDRLLDPHGDGAPREFFPTPLGLARYPRALALPLAVAAALLALALLLLRGSGRAARLAAALAGAGGALFVALLAGIAAVAAARGLGLVARALAPVPGAGGEHPGGSNLLSGEVLSAALWLVALGLSAWALRALGARPRARAALSAGAVVVAVVLALALPLLVPGVGHVGLLCLVGTAGAHAVLSGWRGEGGEGPSARRALLALLAWLPAALVLLPLLPLFVEVGSVRAGEETLFGGPAAGLAVLSALPLLLPLAPRAGRATAPLLFGLGLAAALVRGALVVAGT